MKLNRVLVMNGPNLDMLGTREPEVYGTQTLAALEAYVLECGVRMGVEVDCFQSNHEGDLIDRIHNAPQHYDAIVYNPGAHTHYSYAIRDAVGSIDTPVVEVHLSDIDEREPFRAISVVAPACVGQVKGLGFDSYCEALRQLAARDDLVRLGEGFEARYAPGQVMFGEAAQGGAGAAGGGADAADAAGADAIAAALAAVPDDPQAQGAASARRIGLLRSRMADLGLDGFVVRDTSNIRWLTCFDDVFDSERAHALVVLPDQVILHTDSRYGAACRQAAALIGADIAINEDRVAHGSFAVAQLAELAKAGALGAAGDAGVGADAGADADTTAGVRLGIENDITLAEYTALSKVAQDAGVRVLSTAGIGVGLRAVKDEAELARLRAAQAITDAAFSHIIGFMRPGMTEREVQIELEDFMRRHGASDLAFSSIVACGANGARPHSVPSSTKLEAGQCVVMDFGAKAAGYCSDMTRTVFLGEPSAQLAHAWDVLRQANEECEAMVFPGVTGKEVHEHAEAVLEAGGFGGKMGHGLGHGVGIDEHEQPSVAPRNDKPFVVGNVITIEPGIYIEGEFGMRLEDCGVVTDEGYKRFSKSTHEMVII